MHDPLFPEYDVETISGLLSLRKPQAEALTRLDKILSSAALEKPTEDGAPPHIGDTLEAVHDLYPTCTNFEQGFFSLAFALATGVGKTRLMGAFITYLYTQFGIKHFFVVAPNITIYDKLKNDLGNPDNEKYVFRGIGCFSGPPAIYTKDDYRQKRLFPSDIKIFVYNIDKFNSESAKMRSINEVLGESFVDWLANRPDLVLIMDESHHYRAEKSAEALNLLRPLLGLELTATPMATVRNRQVKFKNVVYEYPLSAAIADGYTRTPFALTRKNLHASNFGDEQLDRVMLEDGLHWHEHIKQRLAQYAEVERKWYVKPFVLVVCQDTAHADRILHYVQSEEFFGGKYRDKTIKIDSKQKKAERDENTKLLLDVEREGNPVEIVIHVNVLKEGWDVNNLYTIIPLRTASSKILREQMVGRGLRLPYGTRTGDREIDAVTLTAHDKFNDLIADAQRGDSIFNAGNIIQAEDIDKEKSENTQLRLNFESDEDAAARQDCEKAGIKPTDANKALVKKFKRRAKEKAVAATQPNSEKKTTEEIAKECLDELTRDEQFAGVYESEQEAFDRLMGIKAAEIHAEVVQKYIPIPRITVKETRPPEYGFADFSLDVSNLRHQPADMKAYAQNLTDARETFILREAGAYFEPTEEPDRLIIRRLRKRPQTDYKKNAELLWKLVREAYTHYENQYGGNGAKNIFLLYQKEIEDEIFRQLMKHQTISEGLFEERVLSECPTNLQQNYHFEEQVDLYSAFTLDIRKVLFDGIEKGVFSTAKFDSVPELTLARIMDRPESKAEKWLRPAPKEFNIQYKFEGVAHDYRPDFVAETQDTRYLIEVKAANMLNDPQVLAKKARGEAYCRVASEWAESAGSKPWRYVFIPDKAIHENATFEALAGQYVC